VTSRQRPRCCSCLCGCVPDGTSAYPGCRRVLNPSCGQVLVEAKVCTVGSAWVQGAFAPSNRQHPSWRNPILVRPIRNYVRYAPSWPAGNHRRRLWGSYDGFWSERGSRRCLLGLGCPDGLYGLLRRFSLGCCFARCFQFSLLLCLCGMQRLKDFPVVIRVLLVFDIRKESSRFAIRLGLYSYRTSGWDLCLSCALCWGR
jgi:hypothetical protein